MSEFNILGAPKHEQFKQNESRMTDTEQLYLSFCKGALRGHPVLSKTSVARNAVCIEWGRARLEIRNYEDHVESILMDNNKFCDKPTTGYRSIVKKFFETGSELVDEISVEILRMDSYFLRHGGCIVEGDETDDETEEN